MAVWARVTSKAESDLISVAKPYNTAPILEFSVPAGSVLDPGQGVVSSKALWMQTLLCGATVPSSHTDVLKDIVRVAIAVSRREVGRCSTRLQHQHGCTPSRALLCGLQGYAEISERLQSVYDEYKDKEDVRWKSVMFKFLHGHRP
jgi:hypothetical protein